PAPPLGQGQPVVDPAPPGVVGELAVDEVQAGPVEGVVRDRARLVTCHVVAGTLPVAELVLVAEARAAPRLARTAGRRRPGGPDRPPSRGRRRAHPGLTRRPILDRCPTPSRSTASGSRTSGPGTG